MKKSLLKITTVAVLALGLVACNKSNLDALTSETAKITDPSLALSYAMSAGASVEDAIALYTAKVKATGKELSSEQITALTEGMKQQQAFLNSADPKLKGVLEAGNKALVDAVKSGETNVDAILAKAEGASQRAIEDAKMTQEEMTGLLNQAAEKVQGTAKEVVSDANAKVEDIKTEVKNATDNAIQKVEGVKTDVNNAVDNATKTAEDAKNTADKVNGLLGK